MDFYTFKDKIESYLPIDFYNEENNAYKKYLIEALSENWNNSKFQICIIVANILFMCYVYKDFYYFKINHDSVSYESGMKTDVFNNANSMFDLSEYSEKQAIYACMKTLQIHSNDIDDAKELVTKRNHCAHASGKIHYVQLDAERYFDDIVSKMSIIEQKREKKLLKSVIDELADYTKNSQNIKEFVKLILEKYSISKQECCMICQKILGNKTNGYEEECFYILLNYYFGKLSEDLVPDKDFEKNFLIEIKRLLLKYENNLEEIKTIIEADLDYQCQQSWDSVSFDDIKRVFVSIKKINIDEKLGIDAVIVKTVDGINDLDMDSYAKNALLQERLKKE